MAIIDFYEDSKQTKQSHMKRTMNAIEAKKFFDTFSREKAAQIRYELNHHKWNTELLGEYPGIDFAKEVWMIFEAFGSPYESFKHECKVIKGMNEQESRDACIEFIFNTILRLEQKL